MKKILILSYYFPPSNNIGAGRAWSFAKYFPQLGLSPTVLTRHWTGGERIWDDYLSGDERPELATNTEVCPVIRLPYKGRKYRFGQRLGRIGNMGFLLLCATAGVLQPEADADSAFYRRARRMLTEDSFDYLLVTSPPFNLVRLGYRLADEFDIPLVVDLRDLWSNNVLAVSDNGWRPRQRVFHWIQEHYAKIWLQKASLISVVSDPMAVEVHRLVPEARTVTVTNGYESSLFESPERKRTSRFTFSVIGTIYPSQDMSIMLGGLQRFLADKDASTIELRFIGTGVIEEVSNIIKRELPADITVISKRVPQIDAVKAMLDSDVLFYPGWKGYRGMVSGKIFEYLAAKRNILIAPSDEDVIERLLKETGAGKTANSINEFVRVLDRWYNEWKRIGVLQYNGLDQNIRRYSRESQAACLASEIIDINGSLPA